MNFEHLLKDIQLELGLSEPLVPDASGRVSLTFDDQWNVTMQQDGDTGAVTLLLPVLAFGDTELGNLHVLARLNKFCFLGVSTAGFAPSYVEEIDSIVLWRRFDDGFADAKAFIAVVSRLLDIAQFLEAQRPEWEREAQETIDRVFNDDASADDFLNKITIMRMMV